MEREGFKQTNMSSSGTSLNLYRDGIVDFPPKLCWMRAAFKCWEWTQHLECWRAVESGTGFVGIGSLGLEQHGDQLLLLSGCNPQKLDSVKGPVLPDRFLLQNCPLSELSCSFQPSGRRPHNRTRIVANFRGHKDIPKWVPFPNLFELYFFKLSFPRQPCQWVSVSQFRCVGTTTTPARVVPDIWSDLLLSDRNERNDIVGAACDVFCLLLVWSLLLVVKGSTIVQDTIPMANLPPTSRGGVPSSWM